MSLVLLPSLPRMNSAIASSVRCAMRGEIERLSSMTSTLSGSSTGRVAKRAAASSSTVMCDV